MRHDKLQRELDLLLLLTENRSYTAKELCDRLNISQRNLYYYFEFFRDAGFNLIKSGYTYRLDRRTTFFQRLHESIDFTEEEAITLRHLLDATDDSNLMIRNIKHKLERFYDLQIVTDVRLKQRAAHIVNVMYKAIKEKKMVKICNYSSPHSHTVSDRYVEPFMFLNGNNDIRCHEVISETNKTFRISRMENAEMIDMLWSNEHLHREVFTDVFMFSGEEKHTVSMLLGQLSYNLLKEEYPQAADYVSLHSDGRWLLQLDVCSYLGIGRFVLGLFDDIEVLGDDGLKKYLSKKAASLSTIYNKV